MLRLEREGGRRIQLHCVGRQQLVDAAVAGEASTPIVAWCLRTTLSAGVRRNGDRVVNDKRSSVEREDGGGVVC